MGENLISISIQRKGAVTPDFLMADEVDRQAFGSMGSVGDGWVQYDNDELEDPKKQKEEDAVANACKNGGCDKLPPTQRLEIQFLYTKALADKLGSKENALKAIESVMTHVQAYYCHNTLGTKVKLAVNLNL